MTPEKPIPITAAELSNLYTQLAEANTLPGQLERRLVPLCPLDLFVFAEKPSGRLGMRVGLPSGLVSAGQELPDLRGLSLTRQDTGGGTNLLLSPKSDAFKEVFVSLAADLTAQAEQNSADGARAAGAALWDRLVRWQAFLKNLPPEGLGPEAQRGLYGELWVLRSCILPHLKASEAIQAWTGPLRTSKDFQFPYGSLEVKTSIAGGDQKLEINGEGQLDDVGLPALLLAYLAMDTLSATGETLPAMVSTVRDAMEEAFEASQKLEDRLREAGYLDAHAAKYQSPGYAVRLFRLFHVREGFPRLSPASLPTGVGNVTYKLTVSACEPFLVSESRLNYLWQGDSGEKET